MKCLIIGYGSIGKRHDRILTDIGCDVAILSSHEKNGHPRIYQHLPQAIEGVNPDYIVIANKTSDHYPLLNQLSDIGYSGKVLVEKPLFSQSLEFESTSFKNLYVGYNLRFHPVLQKVKTLLRGEQVLSVMAYVGQYLPTWRPDRDYKNSYSAKLTDGGGVIRDLSHELDYIQWLFGKCERVVAIGGKFSTLEIESDDVFSLMMSSDACPAISLQLNYLDRLGRRKIVINTDQHTIEADLVEGFVKYDKHCEKFDLARDSSYIKMHEAIIQNNGDGCCTFHEGLSVLNLIEAAELSSVDSRWVSL